MKPNEVLQLTEDEARKYIEKLRWPNGPYCPHCKSDKVYPLNGKATRPGLFKCSDCRKQFTVTVGTVFHKSHIPLKFWVYAFHLVCSSKKGISAHQLHRTLGITYKTAWFLAHRIRHALAQLPFAPIIGGPDKVVEADETYVGGKSKNRPGLTPLKTNVPKKTPVLALVERHGKARVFPIRRVTHASLRKALKQNVDNASTINTDEWSGYKGVGKHFEGGHHTVNHRKSEYSRGDVTTNSAESFFSLLKRGVYGTFHHVSKQHLHRYCDEFEFRWNHRKVSDEERTAAAIRQTGGKRLSYGMPSAA